MDKVIKQRHHLLLIILLVGFLYLMGIIVANSSVIAESVSTAGFMRDSQYFLTAIGAFALLIGLYVLGKRNFGYLPSKGYWVFGAVFLLLALVPVIYRIAQGTYSSYSILRHLSYPFLMVGGIIFLLSVFPKCANGTYIYSLLSAGLIVAALSGCIFSYVNEGEMYARVFQGVFPDTEDPLPTSFTGHRNVYAWLIFMGQVGASYLETRKSRAINWLLILFFTFNQFFIISKSALVVSLALLIVFVISRFVVGCRKNVGKTLAITVISLLVIGGIIALLLVMKANYFSKLMEYIRHTYDVFVEGAMRSLRMRKASFDNALALIGKGAFTSVFGYGYFAWQEVLFGNYGQGAFMDVSWGINLLSGGYVGIAISIFLWVFVLITIIKAMKAKMQGGYIILTVYLLFLARSVVEAVDFMNLDVFGILLYCVTYLPCASYLAKRKELAKEVPLGERERPLYPSKPSIGKIYGLFTPICSITMAMSYYWATREGYFFLLMNVTLIHVLVPLFLYGEWCAIQKGKLVIPLLGIVTNVFSTVLGIVLPIYVHEVSALLITMSLLALSALFFLLSYTKGSFVGIWKNYIIHFLELILVGGIFFFFVLQERLQNPYCLGFIILDIFIIVYVLDNAILKDNDPTISYYEYRIGILAHRLEVKELTGLFLSKKKGEERYSKIDVYHAPRRPSGNAPRPTGYPQKGKATAKPIDYRR